MKEKKTKSKTSVNSVFNELTQTAQRLGVIPLEQKIVEKATPNFDRVPIAEAIARQMLPITLKNEFYLVLADPSALATRNWINLHFPNTQAQIAMTLPGVVADLLKKAEGEERVFDQFSIESEGETTEQDIPEISVSSLASDTSPIIRLLNSTLLDALQNRASDIHLESTPEGLTVKYRVDGVLHMVTQAAGVSTNEQVISRLKVLAGLDISERRVPQDGRFKARISGREVDFRVSIIPSVHGEDAVLRVLDKSSQQESSVRLESLGFDEDTLVRIRALARAPHGMVLVTGPTGSGKSTTLYATLTEINTGEEKIITIEDPVEYQLNGVLQIPVNEKKGLTFARGLRSILRHDPDVILVGEIRDAETAGIAVQAALTGHLVLSSVHANSVFSVLERFLYMDVEPASLLEALNGVIAQRLVRRICDTCAQDKVPEKKILDVWNLNKKTLGAGHFREGAGCEACRGTGYRGRIALAEVLKCEDALKDAMKRRAPITELRALANETGHIPAKTIALAAVRRGETTLQEVQRVISVN